MRQLSLDEVFERQWCGQSLFKIRSILPHLDGDVYEEENDLEVELKRIEAQVQFQMTHPTAPMHFDMQQLPELSAQLDHTLKVALGDISGSDAGEDGDDAESEEEEGEEEEDFEEDEPESEPDSSEEEHRRAKRRRTRLVLFMA